MMDTKIDWDKLEGRQGYHFVISFKPGEATEEIAYQVLKEFCEEYLGDNYDYVFQFIMIMIICMVILFSIL